MDLEAVSGAKSDTDVVAGADPRTETVLVIGVNFVADNIQPHSMTFSSQFGSELTDQPMRDRE